MVEMTAMRLVPSPLLSPQDSTSVKGEGVDGNERMDEIVGESGEPGTGCFGMVAEVVAVILTLAGLTWVVFG